MLSTLKKYFSPIVNHDEQLCFLQIFKPLYVSLSVFGFFPQAVEFSGGKQNAITTSNNTITINLAATYFLFILIHVFFVFHLIDLNDPDFDDSWSEDLFSLMNLRVDLVTEVLFCTISYLCFIRDRHLHIKMLNEMARCWDSLAKGQTQKKQILGRLRVLVNCVVLGFVLVPFLFLLVITYLVDHKTWKNILIAVTFLLPELLQFIFVAYYFTLVLMIVALLKNIEEEFRDILRARDKLRNEYVKPYLGVSIAELSDVYVRVIGFKRQVNQVFQAAILASMAVTFHTMVSTPHSVYHSLYIESNFYLIDVLECGIWIINQLIKMYAYALSGSLLKSQIDEIGCTIHNIPINGDQDWKVLLEILHFSSLMTYQDATITIYGCFPLDATLIFNSIAAAAMYLIIMVQFDMPE